jgi:DNA-binding response OmpR family regulator
MKLLIVDDYEPNVDTMSMFYTMQGHSVDIAHDGATALDKMAERHYDGVIIDYRLPPADGLWVIMTAIEKGFIGRRTATIILTAVDAVDLSEIKQQLIGHKNILLVRKPADPNHLLKDIKAVVNGTNNEGG